MRTKMRVGMIRVLTAGAVAGAAAGLGVGLMGAEPAAPRALPPLPVPPVERQALPPFLERMTITGDPKMSEVFEACIDMAARAKSARARAEARKADAPSPVTGCTNANNMKPDGSIHTEMSCDQAKGAKTTFRVVSDGTPGDLRVHSEMHGVDPATGAAKTMISDSHLVRLGACPADLKPGQMRRPGGPVIDAEGAREILSHTPGQAGVAQ
jgi:hypothetical protein